MAETSFDPGVMQGMAGILPLLAAGFGNRRGTMSNTVAAMEAGGKARRQRVSDEEEKRLREFGSAVTNAMAAGEEMSPQRLSQLTQQFNVSMDKALPMMANFARYRQDQAAAAKLKKQAALESTKRELLRRRPSDPAQFPQWIQSAAQVVHAQEGGDPVKFVADAQAGIPEKPKEIKQEGNKTVEGPFTAGSVAGDPFGYGQGLPKGAIFQRKPDGAINVMKWPEEVKPADYSAGLKKLSDIAQERITLTRFGTGNLMDAKVQKIMEKLVPGTGEMKRLTKEMLRAALIALDLLEAEVTRNLTTAGYKFPKAAPPVAGTITPSNIPGRVVVKKRLHPGETIQEYQRRIYQ